MPLETTMTDFGFKLTFGDRHTLAKIRNSIPKPERVHFDADLLNILAIEKPYLTDSITAGHILFAAATLCAYRQLLESGVSKETAKKQVTTTISKIGQRSIRVIMKLSCFFSKDSFQMIRQYSLTKQKHYGPSFQFLERKLDENDGYAMDVHACGYCKFLTRHNAIDLISAFCEWDKVWIDALPKSILFERPTTIGSGSSSCKFEFRRP